MHVLQLLLQLARHLDIFSTQNALASPAQRYQPTSATDYPFKLHRCVHALVRTQRGKLSDKDPCLQTNGQEDSYAEKHRPSPCLSDFIHEELLGIMHEASGDSPCCKDPSDLAQAQESSDTIDICCIRIGEKFVRLVCPLHITFAQQHPQQETRRSIAPHVTHMQT